MMLSFGSVDRMYMYHHEQYVPVVSSVCVPAVFPVLCLGGIGPRTTVCVSVRPKQKVFECFLRVYVSECMRYVVRHRYLVVVYDCADGTQVAFAPPPTS